MKNLAAGNEGGKSSHCVKPELRSGRELEREFLDGNIIIIVMVHDDKDGEGDDLDPEHLHLPTCRKSSSLATKTKKRMAETRATMTTRIPQKSPVLELRQSTEYLHPMLWSALNSFCFCRRQFLSWKLPQWSRFQPDFTFMFDFYCFTIISIFQCHSPHQGYSH